MLQADGLFMPFSGEQGVLESAFRRGNTEMGGAQLRLARSLTVTSGIGGADARLSSWGENLGRMNLGSLRTSLCTGELNAIRKQKCFICSQKGVSLGYVGKIKSKGPKSVQGEGFSLQAVWHGN